MGITQHRLQLIPCLLLVVVALGGAESTPRVGKLPSVAHKTRGFGERLKVRGIGNFGEVTPRLFRGGQPSKDGFRTLAKMGVDIVVDTRGNRKKSEGKVVGGLGMQYVAIPWHCPFPHDEAFARFLKLVEDNPGKKIFVHCRLGDDRTGMMIAAYRMADENWGANEAMREMQYFGFSRVHHFICPSLASYEKSFPKRLKTKAVFRNLRSHPVNSAQ